MKRAKPSNGTSHPGILPLLGFALSLCPACGGTRFTEVRPGAMAVKSCTKCGGSGFFDAQGRVSA